jgi:glutamate carboxypeptidase
MDTASRLLASVEEREQRLTDFIGALVEAESPSATPIIHRPSHDAIVHALEALDFRVRSIRAETGAVHIMAVPRRRIRHRPLQLLIGHYDTVWPAGTLADRPFTVDGNVIRGPGSFDMKGGLAQMVVALETIRDLGLSMPATPVVFINSDEEIGSRTSTQHIRRLARIAARAFILEPAMGAAGQLKTARKGIGRFKIKVYGKPAHAGLNPEQGSSAILELAQVIQKLFALNDAEAGISVNVGTIDGGIQPNVIAPNSEAVVDVRVPTNADGERIERAIRSLEPASPENRIVVEGGIGRPSMERTPRNQRLWQQAKALGEDLGLELEEARAGGGSDGNTTSLYTATLDGLGPVGDGAHAEHEFLYVDKTLQRAALLGLLLLAPPDAARDTDG